MLCARSHKQKIANRISECTRSLSVIAALSLCLCSVGSSAGTSQAHRDNYSAQPWISALITPKTCRWKKPCSAPLSVSGKWRRSCRPINPIAPSASSIATTRSRRPPTTYWKWFGCASTGWRARTDSSVAVWGRSFSTGERPKP